jgi:hypothetical protein
MNDAFYLRTDDDAYVATEWTRGPWSPAHQHAGPPSALLGHALEASAPDGGRLARCTLEILKPVPIGPLTVTARILRSGRSVTLLAGELLAGGEAIVRGTAWWLRSAHDAVPRVPGPTAPPVGPDESEPVAAFPGFGAASYFEAMEWRFVTGSPGQAGPAAAWMRMRLPLVADEDPTPLVRVLAAADSGNGISGVLPMDRYLFVNTDLSVHLHRHPRGEWVLLDAETTVEADGIGLAAAVLSDESGRIGRSTQTLFVAER